MKHILKRVCEVALWIYFVLSLVLLSGGIMIGIDDGPGWYDSQECHKERPLYYIFPAFKLGCWLGMEDMTGEEEE